MLVQVLALGRIGAKPLPEPIIVYISIIECNINMPQCDISSGILLHWYQHFLYLTLCNGYTTHLLHWDQVQMIPDTGVHLIDISYSAVIEDTNRIRHICQNPDTVIENII